MASLAAVTGHLGVRAAHQRHASGPRGRHGIRRKGGGEETVAAAIALDICQCSWSTEERSR